MTTEIDITNEVLSESIEPKREEIKKHFELNDEQFDSMIRDVILKSFDKLRIRLTEDDPIFAVVLAQKSVMDYYATMIADSLKNISKQIENAVDSRIENIDEAINKVGENFDIELEQFKKSFNSQALELNNQIIASFSKFTDEKLHQIKTELSTIEAKRNESLESSKENKSVFNGLMFVFLLINIAIAGLTLFSVNTGKETKETAYQIGLFNGFQQVRKVLPPKEADKVERIVIEAIDKELKALKK